MDSFFLNFKSIGANLDAFGFPDLFPSSQGTTWNASKRPEGQAMKRRGFQPLLFRNKNQPAEPRIV